MKDIDILVQEERDKRSQELFDKNESELTLEESLKLERYIHDLNNPIWKDILFSDIGLQLRNNSKYQKTGYQISNIGKVKGLNGNILKEYIHPTGYASIGIHIFGKCYTTLIHRLVAIAFIPNLDNKEQVNHMNGKKSINWVGNLEWNTRNENMNHAVQNGLLDIKGDKHPENKYTESQIIEVCKLLENSENTPVSIEKATGVSRHLIFQIRKGSTWTHISSKYNIPKINFNDKHRKYTDNEIIEVCELLEDPMISINEVYMYTGVRKTVINDIIRKHSYMRISDNYVFPKIRKGSIIKNQSKSNNSELTSSTIGQL